MYDGVDRHTVLGATGDPNVPGLGFRYDTDGRWLVYTQSYWNTRCF
jgi:hypothetical protein